MYKKYFSCRQAENVFKRISANHNPNPEAQKRIRENEITSFFGQVSRSV